MIPGLDTLISGIAGGVMRLVPEVMKQLDRKNERAHELEMLKAEGEAAKARGEMEIKQTEVQFEGKELDTLTEAIKGQGAMASAAGSFVASISALVRPLVTYWFMFCYSIVKLSSFLIALRQGGKWEDVTVQLWTSQDWEIFSMILTFWFVGRVWERNPSARKV